MKLFALFCVFIMFSGCAGTKEIYLDQYVKQDFKYTNKTVGFSLIFDDNWIFYPDFASMPEYAQNVAKSINSEQSELVFFAMSTNGLLGARATVEELNLPLEQYYALVREINIQDLNMPDGDQSLDTMFISDLGLLRRLQWDYALLVGEQRFLFRDYQLLKDRYNIRLTFWTLAPLFEGSTDDFQRIVDTYQISHE